MHARGVNQYVSCTRMLRNSCLGLQVGAGSRILTFRNVWNIRLWTPTRLGLGNCVLSFSQVLCTEDFPNKNMHMLKNAILVSLDSRCACMIRLVANMSKRSVCA
jgi:hypothetical protein